MERKVDVTFSMTKGDLQFLRWMTSFQKPRPQEPRDLVGRWRDEFKRALDEHFPKGDDGTVGDADAIRGDPERGQPIATVGEFTSQFEADGSFRNKDGSLRVLFVDPTNGRRSLGMLRFRDSVCIDFNEDVTEGWPRPEPNTPCVSGCTLWFEDDAHFTIDWREGRMTHLV